MKLPQRMVLSSALAVALLGGVAAPALGSRALVKVGVPVITSAPDTLGYGGTFEVGTPDAADVALVFLVPSGAPIPFPVPPHPPFELSVVSRTQQVLTVAEPSSAEAFPSGRYLLAIAVHELTGLLASVGVPIRVRGDVPSPPSSPVPSPTAPAAGGGASGATGGPGGSGGAAGQPGHAGSGGARDTGGSQQGGTAKEAAQAERSPLQAGRTGDRSPLAGFPWLLVVLIVLFGLTARRLARLS